MKRRKWFALLLTLAILFGLIPIRASASGTGPYTVSVVNNDYATGGKSTGSRTATFWMRKSTRWIPHGTIPWAGRAIYPLRIPSRAV